MHILAAFDKCKDSMSAEEISGLAKKTLEEKNFNVVDSVPMSDGGEGFVDIFTEGGNGELIKVEGRDSVGVKREPLIGICELGNLPDSVSGLIGLPTAGKVGIIEMASISGLAQLPLEERNAWRTSTVGVGDLLKKTSQIGVDVILLGIGGSSTNDCGIGALSALGLEIINKVGSRNLFPCPDSWPEIEEIKKSDLFTLPPLKIACDVSNPLLGLNGATHQFGEQKGLSKENRIKMEGQVTELVSKLEAPFPHAKENSLFAGSGAAGGLGYGLSLGYEISLVSGFDLIASWFELGSKIKQADLVMTGEGRFDRTSLLGKAPFELIRLANLENKRSVVLAGSVEKEAVEQCRKQFPLTEVHQFGDPTLGLKKNLERAPELFVKKLKEIFS